MHTEVLTHDVEASGDEYLDERDDEKEATGGKGVEAGDGELGLLLLRESTTESIRGLCMHLRCSSRSISCLACGGSNRVELPAKGGKRKNQARRPWRGLYNRKLCCLVFRGACRQSKHDETRQSVQRVTVFFRD